MRRTVLGIWPAAIAALCLGGCTYTASPPDPIRIVDAVTDVSACRSLGAVGEPVRTDGNGPFLSLSATRPVPAADAPRASFFAGFAPPSTDFGGRLDTMRDIALSRGATDLLLVRKPYRDWSWVQGVAYRCPR